MPFSPPFPSACREAHVSRSTRKLLEPYLYLVPGLVLLGLVFLYSSGRMVYLSFFRAGLLKGTGAFIGLENYRKVLFSKDLVTVLINTLMWVVLSVPPAIALGLLAALLLNNEFRGRTLLRALAFIPWVIPHAIVAVIWRWFLHSEYGLLNQLLLAGGILTQTVSFLTTERALYACIIMRIWRAIPFAIIMFLAGLQSIPTILYEAAAIDGASSAQRLRHITLPLLAPFVYTTTIILTIWTFINFELVYVLTGGGPLDASEILPVRIYKSAFLNLDTGLSSALSVLTLIIVSVLVLFYQRLKTAEEQIT